MLTMEFTKVQWIRVHLPGLICRVSPESSLVRKKVRIDTADAFILYGDHVGAPVGIGASTTLRWVASHVFPRQSHLLAQLQQGQDSFKIKFFNELHYFLSHFPILFSKQFKCLCHPAGMPGICLMDQLSF